MAVYNNGGDFAVIQGDSDLDFFLTAEALGFTGEGAGHACPGGGFFGCGRLGCFRCGGFGRFLGRGFRGGFCLDAGGFQGGRDGSHNALRSPGGAGSNVYISAVFLNDGGGDLLQRGVGDAVGFGMAVHLHIGDFAIVQGDSDFDFLFTAKALALAGEAAADAVRGRFFRDAGFLKRVLDSGDDALRSPGGANGDIYISAVFLNDGGGDLLQRRVGDAVGFGVAVHLHIGDFAVFQGDGDFDLFLAAEAFAFTGEAAACGKSRGGAQHQGQAQQEREGLFEHTFSSLQDILNHAL